MSILFGAEEIIFFFGFLKKFGWECMSTNFSWNKIELYTDIKKEKKLSNNGLPILKDFT